MSGIREIEYMMHGDKEPVQKTEEYVPDRIRRTDAPKAGGRIVFKLLNSNKEGGVKIQGVDFVIDPTTITPEKPNGDGPEMIRLVVGSTSIWAKDQKNLTEDYIRRNIRYLEWPRGSKFMFIPEWDVAALAFARITRHNIRSGNNGTGTKTEFFEYDSNEAAKAQYDKEMLEIDMVLKAKEQSEDKMKKHAFFLGIELFDKITGAPKSMEVLRTEYILRAKRNPKEFRDSFDSKEVDVRFKIRNLIIDGKIDLTRSDGKACWGKNGGVICPLPKGEDPISYLTQLALTNSKEGKEFIKDVDRLST